MKKLEIINGNKFCNGCKVLKPIEEFYKRKKDHTLHPKCKKCMRDIANNWDKKNIKKKREGQQKYRDSISYEVKRDQFLRSTYRISFKDFNKMLYEQDYKCKICKSVIEKEKILVDHCHSTNKVRGLLCYACNTGLGLFKDNETLLINAIEYLRISKTSPAREDK